MRKTGGAVEHEEIRMVEKGGFLCLKSLSKH
jgi:hypothetical protein